MASSTPVCVIIKNSIGLNYRPKNWVLLCLKQHEWVNRREVEFIFNRFLEILFIVVFLLQMLEEQLEQERRRTTLDFSDRDFKMKSEYEKRLKSELKGLRKKYRQETERTKKEFMNLHLKKVCP